ncbi:MAG TPA: hypothetical protein DIT25_03000 [Candidatus Moranbacteria bacterium]|nr:hypothetical protein [Candidatus Moranbacteria bacterium]
MQNFSHNSNSQADDQAADQDKSRQKNTIQRDMIMLESDLRKLTSEKIALDSEIRSLKKDDAHIKISLKEKQTRLGKVDYELIQMDANMKNLKKKLNAIL